MKKKSEYELQNVCGDYLLVSTGVENVNLCQIIELNETAAYLWKNLSDTEPFDVDTLVELLMKEYEVEKDIATEDCKMIAERWIEIGIAEE